MLEFISGILHNIFIKIEVLFHCFIIMTSDLNIKDEHTAKPSKHNLYLKVSNKKVREGWRESARAITRDSDDDLLLEQFPNASSSDLDW